MNPAEVHGAWRRGWTLDAHTVSSEFIGYDQNGHAQFDTTRSEIGELLYQLKYRGNQQNAIQVARLMKSFFDNKPNTLDRIDIIVPIPPSTSRATQPVAEVAQELSRLLKKSVALDAIQKKHETPELKNVHELEERRALLDNAFEVESSRVKGKGILLLDDLYRSGSTANAVTIALLKGGAERVYFLAATRTRSNT